MHANCLAEFHVVWHWRGSIMETRWYVGARSCIRCCDHARTIDNRSEALRPMVNILANDREIARWCRPPGLPDAIGEIKLTFPRSIRHALCSERLMITLVPERIVDAFIEPITTGGDGTAATRS